MIQGGDVRRKLLASIDGAAKATLVYKGGLHMEYNSDYPNPSGSMSVGAQDEVQSTGIEAAACAAVGRVKVGA